MDNAGFTAHETTPVTAALEQRVLSDFTFENGARLAELTIGYATYGALNAARDNVILLFHGAAGNCFWAAPFIRAGGAFDPEKYFLVSFDAMGGGVSSKPSDGLATDFPHYSIADIVTAQTRIVGDELGLDRVYAVAGASMGAMTSLEWASRFGAMIGRAALIVPGYRCDTYARAIFSALEAMITFDPQYGEGRYEGRPTEGIRRAGAIMLPHVLSRPFLASQSPETLAEISAALGDRYAADWDPNDVIWRYRAVSGWDFGERHGGLDNFAQTIRCPTLFLPSTSDLIFPIAEVRDLAERLPNSVWAPIQSDWGHMAGARPPGSPEFEMMDRAIASFMEQG